MLRHYGNFKFYTGYKLSNGVTRCNHRLLEFSDRDMVRFEAPLGLRPLGKYNANRKLIETCVNFKPDLVLIGHCDLISEKTLQEIRRLLPDVKIAHWFLDALWNPRNHERLKRRMHCTDALFITTGGPALKEFCTGKNRVAYIPNPTDPSWEPHKNDQKTQFERDLVFCGVGSKSDDRFNLLLSLKDQLEPSLHFETFGILGGPAVWGDTYDQVIAHSKMALNLNREEGWPLYSSDRLSQLIGNGLLTFIWDKGEMRQLFNDEQVVFFKDEAELSKKIQYFQANDTHRQAVARAGRKHYQQHFSAQKVIEFIIDTTFGHKNLSDTLWGNQVYD